ncbi:tetratricopeptide repeat protein [Pseudomonas rubra]|uniref:Tetratricopeptide repeat protein n=1 Tax=Pseudomonas rubra TaxID=2942627 RepID=A0ABT5P749_9PSED|nr:tetratricopeptide repeat protein [Pseudomonas rubra]MDD1013893.1 tetratricopeptide repeat protein [Pseudomonas rubra]MDD1038286.1 tetratricopeptide repeat protein [Pseudomonas rubra]MDD1154624.1 tetratricopeptide repeat protein [Pseudomonas rubra]
MAATRLVLLILVWLASSIAWATGELGRLPETAKTSEGYARADSCQGCHAEQMGQWQHSDHAWALRDANASNVLGNFDDVRFDEAGVKARFFRKGGGFFVNIEGEQGKPEDFRILYTFGHRPLQQYLVALSRGRLQALTIAWDSRTKEQGGQRWFSLYPGQRFTPDDPLHWTGRYQNWNAMCADCHSTRLQKHYDEQQDSFASTWQEQTVGCQGCHGPGQKHVDWARAKPAEAKTDKGLVVDFKALGSRGMVEQCAYCHSRRQGLGDGQLPGHPQLDQSLPATLRQGLYHGDGQIDGEVYEFGSFTQSKMYAAGVACTDCHNPHTSKVRIEGNGLCLQCHNTGPDTARFAGLQAKDYDSPSHHHHVPGSPGAQCVNCHMPSKTYMEVDPRRDHSLRIPRPDLAAQTASPDACTGCHQDRQPAWAASAIEQWLTTPKRPVHYGQALQGVRADPATALSRLGYVLNDPANPAIVRATAADQLADLGPAASSQLRWALQDPEPLVRAYAVAGFASVPAEQRLQPLLPLLEDPRLAVRDETVRALADIPVTQLPQANQAMFQALLADYERRLRGNADLPGGRLNLAVLLSRQGRDEQAMEQYRKALGMDPYFVPARVNLVTLANAAQRPDEAERLLRDGVALAKMPVADRGNLAYMLALLLVERGQAEEALGWMEQAAEAVPGNPRIRYNQGLLLSRMQRRDEALQALRSGLQQSPDDPDLLYSLIYLHALAGEREQAFGYVQHLREVAPDDPRLQAIEPYWRNGQ